MSGQNPAVLKIVDREFLILLRINGMCYSLRRIKSRTWNGVGRGVSDETKLELGSVDRRVASFTRSG